jgi:hypothetical protein
MSGIGLKRPRWEKFARNFPKMLEKLVKQKPLPVRDLTTKKLTDALENGSTAGVYVFSRVKRDIPFYVGRSKNLPRRVGVEHRSQYKNSAHFVYALMKRNGFKTVEEAQRHFFENFHVRFITVADPVVRAAFELYAAVELGTVDSLEGR